MSIADSTGISIPSESNVHLGRAQICFVASEEEEKESLSRAYRQGVGYILLFVVPFLFTFFILGLQKIVGISFDVRYISLLGVLSALPFGIYGILQEFKSSDLKTKAKESSATGVSCARDALRSAIEEENVLVIKEAYFLLLKNNVGPWEAFRLLAEIKEHSEKLFLELFDESCQGFAESR